MSSSKEYLKQYRETHHEQRREYDSRPENRARRRVLYFANRDAELERYRAWYRKDLEVSRAKSRARYYINVAKSRLENRLREHNRHYKCNPIKGRARVAKRAALLRRGPLLTKEVIQSIYEDNIKLFGTLTCWCCFKPVAFGDDHLEHDFPVSRGGLNIKSNLGVAHAGCNRSKGCRTRVEYWEQEGITPGVSNV